MPHGTSVASGKGHGVVERGLESAPRSRSFEGRFGRMFRTLPAATFDDAELDSLAAAMTAAPEPGLTPEDEVDDEENFGLPAGYTYLGQFIDHDITFDPLSSLVKQNDPDGLIDFRTPLLDLDSLYARGPDDQPYMYEPDGRRFRLGDRILTGGDPEIALAADLPRFHERALIGDKRNDENVIVSQLHGLFLRFHNHLATANPRRSFEEIQQLVRWHYQWIVIFDFLPRIVGRDPVEAILPHLKSGKSIHQDPPRLLFYHWRNDPFMPVEFSGAAYRFGHSMVRPDYRLSLKDLPASGSAPKGLNGRKLIFAPDPKDGLNGFHEFPLDFGIDWKLFFETKGHKLSPKNLGKMRVQPAYKMDTSLVSPLGALPEFSKPGTDQPLQGQINVLARRNLLRGARLGLPSGQAVARFMGLTPIPDSELLVGKANVDGLKTNKPVTHGRPGLADNAPLWFYVLAEAQHQWVAEVKAKKADDQKNTTPTRLGPVGGRIVGEVLIGLVLGNRSSFLSLDPGWTPLFGNPRAASPFDRFTMGDLVQAVPSPRRSDAASS
jgi:hypothetical protein